MYLVVLILSVLCFIGVVVAYSRSKAFSIFHPLSFYLAFHGFIFVFRPIVAYMSDFTSIYETYRFTPSLSDKITVIAASNLGMLAFAFASIYVGGSAIRFKQDVFAVAERNRLVPAALFAIAICAPIGMYSLSLEWGRSSIGITGTIMDRGTGVYINTDGNGYINEAQLMLATCCAMLGWLFRFRLIALAPLAAFILIRAGTGGRGPFVTAAVCLGLLWMYEHRRRLPTMRVVYGAIAVMALFVIVGQDRGRAIRMFVAEDNTWDRYGARELKFLEGMDFGNLEYFEYLVYVVPQRSHSYEYFADNLQLFTEPIPRKFWPGKPRGSPVQFFQLFDYGYPIGMTRSLPGEGWTQLGWLGVIIWCGLWGLLTGNIYRRFVEGNQSAFMVLSYMTFAPMLIIVFRDGTLMTLLRQAIFFYTPIVVWKGIASYTGVPSAQWMRVYNALMQRRKALQGETVTTGGTGDPNAPNAHAALQMSAETARQFASLPPAVQRRRLQLMAMRQQPAE